MIEFFSRVRPQLRQLRKRSQSWPLIRIFRCSLTLRLTLVITLSVLIVMEILSVFVTTHVRDGIFERHLNQVISDASLRSQSVQSAFDQANADSVSTLQDTAYTLMSENRDAIAGAGGAGVMLIRDPHETIPLNINSIIDEDVRELLSDQLRQAVQKKDGLHWQSVALRDTNGEQQPAIIVGSYLNLPLVGGYEFYTVYSLESEQDTLDMINQVLVVGTIVVMILLVVLILSASYSVLRPIGQVAEAARSLSAGKLEQRLRVEGEDELAKLQLSFNEMAQSLQEQIHDYQQLATLQQRFVSDVSHELRTPLTTIRMASDLLYEQREELDPMLERSVTLLHRQVDRFDQMLADLIEISRIDAQTAQLKTQSKDLVEVAQNVIENAQVLAEKLEVEVRLEAPGGPVWAEIDETRVARVIRNLLVNAIEYAEGKPVIVTVAGTATSAAVQVRDYGAGMTDEVARHVFDRFYRADPSRKRTTGGTGLGLAISAEDAALHGGLLTVLSCPGAGSAFLLLLPKQQGKEITDIPSSVDNQDLLLARERWAKHHPDEHELTQLTEENELVVHPVTVAEPASARQNEAGLGDMNEPDRNRAEVNQSADWAEGKQ